METGKDMRATVKDMAIENYKNGLNCCESVYDALLRSGALKAPKETTALCVGFGGGIGLTGNACGALSGAVMAVGAMHGRPDPWSVDGELRGAEIAQKYYRRYNKLVHDFEELAGAVACRDICAAYEDWESKDRRKACLKLIGETAAIAWENMQIPQEEAFALPYGQNMRGME